jgi:protein SCO1/2
MKVRKTRRRGEGDTDGGYRRDKPGGSLGRSVDPDAQRHESQTARGRHAERACYFRIVAVIGVALIVVAWPRLAAAQRFATGGPYNAPAGASPTAALLSDVGIDQHLDAQLPLDAVFRDEAGREVRLGEYFTNQPVVLALVYYRCPQLCTQVLNGLLKSSQAVPLEIGRDYQVVTVSFDPDEGPELAAEKKRQYIRAYRRDGGARGWHFLTGDGLAIERLATTVGFRYRYEPRSKQFAHASGIVIATPEGRLARYLYGIDYSPHDLRLGLIESSAGRIGSPVDQVLLLCYHYDPLTGKYGLAIAGVLRTAGGLTVLGLGTFLVAMYRREKRRPKLPRTIGTTADCGAGVSPPPGRRDACTTSNQHLHPRIDEP